MNERQFCLNLVPFVQCYNRNFFIQILDGSYRIHCIYYIFEYGRILWRVKKKHVTCLCSMFIGLVHHHHVDFSIQILYRWYRIHHIYYIFQYRRVIWLVAKRNHLGATGSTFMPLVLFNQATHFSNFFMVHIVFIISITCSNIGELYGL
jgi:hypothetical protein